MNNSSVLARFVKTRILKFNKVFLNNCLKNISSLYYWVQHDAEVEDQQEGNNRVEIEEHILEVQEGPLVDENDGDNEHNLYDQVNMAE